VGSSKYCGKGRMLSVTGSTANELEVEMKGGLKKLFRAWVHRVRSAETRPSAGPCGARTNREYIDSRRFVKQLSPGACVAESNERERFAC
jgi:hypothetical protein